MAMGVHLLLRWAVVTALTGAAWYLKACSKDRCCMYEYATVRAQSTTFDRSCCQSVAAILLPCSGLKTAVGKRNVLKVLAARCQQLLASLQGLHCLWCLPDKLFELHKPLFAAAECLQLQGKGDLILVAHLLFHVRFISSYSVGTELVPSGTQSQRDFVRSQL